MSKTSRQTHSHQVTVAGKLYTTNAKAHDHTETPESAETDPVASPKVVPLEAAVRDLTARVAALEAGGEEPPVPPPSGITFLTGFGAAAKGGTVPALVRTVAELEAAVKVPDRLITFPPGAVIDFPTSGLTMAERVTIDGQMDATLVGGAIQWNNGCIVRRTRLHYRHVASGAADILWAKFDKHDWVISQNDLVATAGIGEPDGWTDATRNCYDGTLEFNRYIGIPGYHHNLQVLLSNGTKLISVHHNHFLDCSERLPGGFPGDSGGPLPGATEATFDSLGNVIDGCDSYAMVCQQGGHCNDRWNTYNAPDRAPATSWAFDIEAANSKVFSLGSEVNGRPYTVLEDTPDANVTVPFPSPDVSYGLATRAAHEALTVKHAGVNPPDAIARAALQKWGRL